MTRAGHGTTEVVCISSTAWFARETHRKNEGNETMGKHLPEHLLMLVKSGCRTNNGRVSNSANHFISDPSSGGCTGNITSRVNSNCSHSIVGPAGRRQENTECRREFWVFLITIKTKAVSLHPRKSRMNSNQFLPPRVEIFPHACVIALVFFPFFSLFCSHQRVSRDGGHANALCKQVCTSAGQQQMGSLEYSAASLINR